MRIAGVTLPKSKRVVIALTYIFGIGQTRAKKVLEAAKVDENIRVQDLTPDQQNAIRSVLEKTYRVEGELRREVVGNIKRLADQRHFNRLKLLLQIDALFRQRLEAVETIVTDEETELRREFYKLQNS